MGYEELSFRGLIDEIKRVGTKGAPHPRKFCFVLGAGASVTSGIPSGQKLVDEWDRELTLRSESAHKAWLAKENITPENKYSSYSKYYERMFDPRTSDGLNYMESLMQSAKPGVGYVLLAHVLTATDHNIVITTNFDHLTEDAVTYYAQKTPLIIGHESLAHYINGHPSRATIIKIHRDLLFDPKSRAEDIEVLHDNWIGGLSRIFENYHPVFIGYAGNDNSLMDFLLDNAEKFLTGQWKFPYWTLYKQERMEGKVLEFMDKSQGYVTRHNGFDRVMIELSAIFDYQLPSEEQFLKDARDRHKSLTDALASLSGDGPEESAGAPVDTVPAAAIETSSPDKETAVERLVSQAEQAQLYQDASSLKDQGNYPAAIEKLEQLIQLSPDDGDYQLALAECYARAGEKEKALIAYRTASSLEPNDSHYHRNVGFGFTGLIKYDEALTEFQKCLALAPENATYLYDIASALNRLNNPGKALPYIEKAIFMAPTRWYFHSLYAQILEKLGRKEDAEAARKKSDLLRK